jgi:stearoyl-CoA desaturase (delta-9 desaturase)
MTTSPVLEPQIDHATMGGEVQSRKEQIALALFIAVPLLAVVAAVPVAWGGWLGWTDLIIAATMYWFTGHGVTVGFHRLFTHKSFKPNRFTKNALGVAGSMAIQGPLIRWVADHRKHHKFSDRDGDPHSPWKYGTNARALWKGLWHAHLGWLFDTEQTPQRKYAPDLLKDPDLVRISRHFWFFVIISLALPAVLGGLITWSWQGALTAFFWGSLVRVAALHHVTWSINSICHAVGKRPSPPATSPATSGGWRSRRWASPGTTCTTPIRPAHATASCAVSWTRPRG